MRLAKWFVHGALTRSFDDQASYTRVDPREPLEIENHFCACEGHLHSRKNFLKVVLGPAFESL